MLAVAMRLDVLRLAVALVPVQGGHGALWSRGPRKGLRSGGVHGHHGRALPHLGVPPQGLGNHDIGDGHDGHAADEVGDVEVEDDLALAAGEAGHGQAEAGAVGFQGGQGGQGEAGGPQEQGEEKSAGEGGGAVRLLPQHHAQPVQGDDCHRLERHDDEARAGEVEGEAEGARDASGRVEEEDKGEHGGGRPADEEIAEGEVEDHEVEVGPEFPEGRVEEGQENDEVAVGAQAEDEGQQGGAGRQGGGVGPLPQLPGAGAAVPAQRQQRRQRGARGFLLAPHRQQPPRRVHLRPPPDRGCGRGGPAPGAARPQHARRRRSLRAAPDMAPPAPPWRPPASAAAAPGPGPFPALGAGPGAPAGACRAGGAGSRGRRVAGAGTGPAAHAARHPDSCRDRPAAPPPPSPPHSAG